jgi:hypothetical protein
MFADMAVRQIDLTVITVADMAVSLPDATGLVVAAPTVVLGRAHVLPTSSGHIQEYLND